MNATSDYRGCWRGSGHNHGYNNMNITVIITSQILKSKKIMRWEGKRLSK